MSLHLFSSSRLAREIRAGTLPPSARVQYLAAGMILWTVLGASGMISSSPLWTFASLVETVLAVAITVVGISTAYRAGRGDENPEFIWQFTCFYVPVSVTTVIAVWGLYWLATLVGPELIVASSRENMEPALGAARAWSAWSGAFVTLAFVATQAITMYRITSWMKRVHEQAA